MTDSPYQTGRQADEFQQPSHVRLMTPNLAAEAPDEMWVMLGDFRVRLVQSEGLPRNGVLVVRAQDRNIVIHPVTGQFIYLEAEK